ncbi:hypothetical protein ACHAPX_007956 [Trichoderma viride]
MLEYGIGASLVQNARVSSKVQAYQTFYTAQPELLLTVRIMSCATIDAGIKRRIIDMQSKAELFDTGVK